MRHAAATTALDAIDSSHLRPAQRLSSAGVTEQLRKQTVTHLSCLEVGSQLTATSRRVAVSKATPSLLAEAEGVPSARGKAEEPLVGA